MSCVSPRGCTYHEMLHLCQDAVPTEMLHQHGVAVPMLRICTSVKMLDWDGDAAPAPRGCTATEVLHFPPKKRRGGEGGRTMGG
jgi:hypothetical protein